MMMMMEGNLNGNLHSKRYIPIFTFYYKPRYNNNDVLLYSTGKIQCTRSSIKICSVMIFFSMHSIILQIHLKYGTSAMRYLNAQLLLHEDKELFAYTGTIV